MRYPNNKITNHKSVLLGIVFCVAVTGLVGFLHPGHASAVTDTAISNHAPMLESGEYYKDNTYQGQYRGWFALATGTSNAPTAWQKIYVPINKLTPTTITITNGGGYCFGPSGTSNTYDQFTPEVNYTLQDLDKNENMVAGVGALNLAQNSLSGGTACRNLTFIIPPGVGARSSLYGHTRYRVYFLVAQMVTPVGCGNILACSYGKLFQLDANDPSVLIGFSRSVNSTTSAATARPFGVAARPLYLNGPAETFDPVTKRWTFPPYDWSFSFQFAPRCEEDSPSSQLNVYDVDNGVVNTNPVTGESTDFLPQYLSADLYTDNRDTPGFSWVQQPGSPGPHTWSANQLGPYGVDLAQTTLVFPTSSHNRYRLHMNQFNYHNVIQFYVPLDQFDADSNIINCFDSVCKITQISSVNGTVNPNKKDYINPPDPVVTAGTGQTISLKIEMTNTGDGPWTYDPSDPNSHFALGQFNPPSGSLVDFNNRPPPPPYVIEPDEIAKFDIFISSSTALSARYVYQMQDAGARWFGSQCSLDISITGGPIPPVQASCTQVGVRISGASVRTNTPTRVTFTDPASGGGGAPTVVYNFNISLDNPDFGQKFFDPFRNGLGAQLYPHVKYNIALEVQADSRNSNWSPVGSGAFAQQCLTPTCDPLGFSDMEAGDTTAGTGRKQSYGITLNNQTNQTFNPNIYLANISSSGGVIINNASYNPSNPVTARLNNGSSTDLNTSFDVILNSPSTIRASLQFDLPGGTPVATIDGYYPGLLACAQNFNPSTKPYFKAFGGDVSAGGSYNTGAGSNNCILPSPPGVSADYGSIKAYANSDTSTSPSAINKRVGASTDFGAFLTGSIFTDSTKRLGFYTGLPAPFLYSGLTSPTVFANTGVPSWGGGFVNHCIYDYFSALEISITSWNGLTPTAFINDSNTITGYRIGNSTMRVDAGGSQLFNHPTIIVEGNVLISQNIAYNSGWTWSIGNPPPLFMLIVKGNLYIDQAVTRLDGIYEAQPDASGNGGQIYTCTNGSTIYSALDRTICNNKLTVNGTFIAKHVHLLRTNGTLRSAFLSGNTETYASGANPNIAEQFNYNPEILMAAPTISNSGSTSTTPVRLDSLISLPPVL